MVWWRRRASRGAMSCAAWFHRATASWSSTRVNNQTHRRPLLPPPARALSQPVLGHSLRLYLDVVWGGCTSVCPRGLFSKMQAGALPAKEECFARRRSESAHTGPFCPHPERVGASECGCDCSDMLTPAQARRRARRPESRSDLLRQKVRPTPLAWTPLAPSVSSGRPTSWCL